jgi:hypothetical protein
MNQNEIITALKFDAKYWLAKKYANKLQSLFNLINELEKLDGFKVELKGVKGNVDMVNELPEIKRINYKLDSQYNDAVKQQEYCRNLYGEFEQWQNVVISHKTGCYRLPFPIGNKFYNVIAGMAGEAVEVEDKKDVVILKTITLESKALKELSKAVKFISKDDLRPKLQCVCLAFENYTIEVVATDCHKLFLSPKFGSNVLDRVELLINEKAVKTISKMKHKTDNVDIHILADDKIMIAGEIFDIHPDNFVDYRCVMPEYKTYMEFNRKALIDNVNKVKPYANKSTQQVNFHLNGSIALHSQDVDFSFECNADMPYISKNFPDTDIAFNGNLLNECLATFKDTNVKMLTNGINTQAAIFTNDVDTILLMPLMLNN